jgi:hypothetical protein
MSTVRMADYLRREIVRKFESLYDKSNPVQKISTHVGDKMYDIFLAPKINLFLDTANEQFEGLIDSEALFVTNNELNIKLNLLQYKRTRDDVNSDDEITEYFETNVQITLPLSSEMLQLKQVDGWRDESVVLNIEKITAPASADLYLDKIRKVTQAESKRKCKREVDSRKVERALTEFTTLNQALKAWPALTKLVSQDKISKVHEKQQRKRKEQQQRSKIEPIEPGLNQTILTATLLGDD